MPQTSETPVDGSRQKVRLLPGRPQERRHQRKMGKWGVEQFDEPSGGYKIRRGIAEVVAQRVREEADNEDQAELSKAEMLENLGIKSPFPKLPDSSGSGNRGHPASSRGSAASASQIGASPCPSTHAAGAASPRVAPSPYGPSSEPASNQSIGGIDDDDDSSRLGRGAAPSDVETSTSTPAKTTRKRSPSPANTLRSVASKGKSKAGVIEEAAAMAEHCEKDYSPVMLWQNKKKSREVKNHAARLNSMAQRLTKVKTDPLRCERLSGTLLELGETIQARFNLLTGLRDRPQSFVAEMTEEEKKMVGEWPKPLVTDIANTVGCL